MLTPDYSADTLNRLRLKAVATQLGPLNEQVVYVGGATVSLYVAERLAIDIRPTEDVDVVIELASYLSYSQLDEQLRQLGFQNDMMSGVICRYQLPSLLIDVVERVRVDIMPTNPAILGFSNRWYGEGYERAIPYALDAQTTIKLFPLAYFVASKLEAFAGRGGRDLRFSTDFEDIVFVLDNAPNVLAQLRSESKAVVAYLQERFGQLLSRPDLQEGIYVHLPPRFATARLEGILDLLQQLTS
jgi:predicted nucleotidyltransferase